MAAQMTEPSGSSPTSAAPAAAVPPLQTIVYLEADESTRAVVTRLLTVIGGFHVHGCASEAELPALTAAPHDLLLLHSGRQGADLAGWLREVRASAHAPVILVEREHGIERDQWDALGLLGALPSIYEPLSMAWNIRQLWHCRAGQM